MKKIDLLSGVNLLQIGTNIFHFTTLPWYLIKTWSFALKMKAILLEHHRSFMSQKLLSATIAVTQ